MFKFLISLLAIISITSASTDSDSISNETSSSDDSNEIHFGRRIIGGLTADPGQYTYVIRIKTYFGRNRNSFCSGTILNNQVILTAAHCLYSQGRKAYWAAVQIKLNEFKYSTVYFSQDEMYVHPSYNERFADDIALLKLNSYRQPIKISGSLPQLPDVTTVSDMFTDTNAVVAGWGKTSDNSGLSNKLQYAHVNIISNNNCSQYYGRLVTQGVICTLNLNKGICGGDSGGPLMMTRNSQIYVVGVNAFGYKLCEQYYPSGYTNVINYIDWLKSIMN